MEAQKSMVDTELEQKIRKTIEEVYNCECTFRIKASIKEGAYIVFLFLHEDDKNPLHMLWDGESEEAFFKWFKKELKLRNLIRSSFVKIQLAYDQ